MFLICASWTCGAEPAGKGDTGLILGMLARTTAAVLEISKPYGSAMVDTLIKSGHLNFWSVVLWGVLGLQPIDVIRHLQSQ